MYKLGAMKFSRTALSMCSEKGMCVAHQRQGLTAPSVCEARQASDDVLDSLSCCVSMKRRLDSVALRRERVSGAREQRRARDREATVDALRDRTRVLGENAHNEGVRWLITTDQVPVRSSR